MNPAAGLNLHQAWLRTRRSVRHFLPEPPPAEVVEHILETATWAPSAHNRQPWRFVVLTSPAVKTTLAEGMAAQLRQDLLADGCAPEEIERQAGRSLQRIQSAPLAVLLCLEAAEIDVCPDAARQAAATQMAVQSVALAGGTLLLAAHAEGLGGVWVCAPLFAPQAAQQALDLPEGWLPQALLLLGYPARLPEPRPRRPLAEVVVYR